MPHWERNFKGRLVKLDSPNSSILSLDIGNFLHNMENQGDDQQSHQGANEVGFNLFRSMRDHMHPPMMNSPSCIVLP